MGAGSSSHTANDHAADFSQKSAKFELSGQDEQCAEMRDHNYEIFRVKLGGSSVAYKLS